MDTIFAQRPHFFEGQYLGADDLETFLTYAAANEARHLLGAHTWGIVSGIELITAPALGGGVDFLLTPGVAVDGYGRLIVVETPFKLTTDLFSSQPSGRVNVWIRREDTPFSATRPGYQACDCSDSYARVNESFVVEVGPRNTVDLRESGVTVGGTPFTDARDALGDPLLNQPLACDGSVPMQSFPADDDPSLWLIPVCQAPWNQATAQLTAPNETDQKMSRIFRREAGLVTEHIYPAAGVIRLRPRWSARRPGVSSDQICKATAIQEADLVTCGGELTFREMIWLEGNARFRGDARLYGSRLEFQEAGGTDYLNNGVPLAMRRRPDKSEVNGYDLQVLLGKRQGADGPTRLAIGQAVTQGANPCSVDFQFTAGVCIQEDAKVGIGAADSVLTMPLTIRATGANGDLIGFQTAAGALAWQMNFGAKTNGLNFTEADPASTRLFLQKGGDVGIGTLTPEANLDIRGVLSPPGNALGGNKWFQVGDGGDAGRIWLQYGAQLAPLLVMSDFDDPPRIQFQQIGNGQETGPQFASWMGQARNSSADLAMMGGSVGVNTTTPFRLLDVEGSEIHSGGPGAGFSFGNREDGSVEAPANGERWVWYATARIARLWSGGDKLAVTSGGNVGIATLAPADRLDVRGNIRLGANGDFYGVGCLDNLRMVAGGVGGAGAILSGSGFMVARVGVGTYQVTYNVPFATIPVVVATLVDAPNEDNFLTVDASGVGSFTLVSKDNVPGLDAQLQDSAFNFIALGGRA